MKAGAWTTAPRADRFAGAAVAALGLHVWIAMIVLPGVFAEALSRPAALAAAVAPGVLAAGLWRRSDWMLILAFPAAVVAAAAAAPQVVSSHAYDAIRWAAVAASLVGYLFAASALCTDREPAPSLPRRRLPGAADTPARWRRRLRVYRGLAALSVAFPAVFIYAIHVHAEHRAYLRELYPGRVEATTTALAVLALCAWIAIFTYAFAGVLGAHRAGDRALRASLTELRRHAARAHPRPGFYVAIATAIALTLLLVALRAHGPR